MFLPPISAPISSPAHCLLPLLTFPPSGHTTQGGVLPSSSISFYRLQSGGGHRQEDKWRSRCRSRKRSRSSRRSRRTCSQYGYCPAGAQQAEAATAPYQWVYWQEKWQEYERVEGAESGAGVEAVEGARPNGGPIKRHLAASPANGAFGRNMTTTLVVVATRIETILWNRIQNNQS